MASNLLAQMRSVIQPNPLTSPFELTLDDSTPLPTPIASPAASAELLIRVHAFAPCKGELTWARDFPSMIPASRLAVPGQDVAGIIVGPSPLPSMAEARGLEIGQRVYARIEADRPGAARDYATVRVSELARVPEPLSWTDAAAVPLSALTAWQALFWQARGVVDERAVLSESSEADVHDARAANATKSVLVTGASGAVGGWAVQLACAAGVKHIVAVGGGESEEVMRALGATDVLDYKSTRVTRWVDEDASAREVDLVVDCVGGAGLADLWTAVGDGGHISSACGDPESARPAGAKPKATGQFFVVRPLGSNLEQVSALLEKGVVRPLVDSVYGLEKFQEAFDRAQNGKGLTGKVVVTMSKRKN